MVSVASIMYRVCDADCKTAIIGKTVIVEVE